MARLLLVATMLSAWTATAHADPIGKVVEVAQNAFADNAGAKRDLASGADVAALEVISTDKIGKAALRFADDTRLSIGPGAAVVLDRFVYDPEKSSSAFVIKATKGAFRFATGRGDHAAYRIETPTASIGVRGTEFDVVIGEKSVRISMRSGLVNVCPNGSAGGGGCADARKGQSVIAEPGRARTVPTKSLPPVRLALLPLPVAVLPKTLANTTRPVGTPAAAAAAKTAGAARGDALKNSGTARTAAKKFDRPVSQSLLLRRQAAKAARAEAAAKATRPTSASKAQTTKAAAAASTKTPVKASTPTVPAAAKARNIPPPRTRLPTDTTKPPR